MMLQLKRITRCQPIELSEQVTMMTKDNNMLVFHPRRQVAFQRPVRFQPVECHDKHNSFSLSLPFIFRSVQAQNGHKKICKKDPNHHIHATTCYKRFYCQLRCDLVQNIHVICVCVCVSSGETDSSKRFTTGAASVNKYAGYCGVSGHTGYMEAAHAKGLKTLAFWPSGLTAREIPYWLQRGPEHTPNAARS